jgi:hypothetical protein
MLFASNAAGAGNGWRVEIVGATLSLHVKLPCK